MIKLFKNFRGMPIINQQFQYLFKKVDGMNYNLKNRMFVGFVIGLCLVVSSSLVVAGDSGGISQKEPSGIKSPYTAGKIKDESLTNQSTLVEYSQKYLYRYYPECSVYYDINRKLYFYPENDNWKIFAILPEDLKRKLDHYIEIEMENDKPYTENEKHVKKYPPQDSKKTKKNMWSRLIFFLFYDHATK